MKMAKYYLRMTGVLLRGLSKKVSFRSLRMRKICFYKNHITKIM